MKRFLSIPLLFAVSVMAYGAAATESTIQAKRSAVAEFKERTQQQMALCSTPGSGAPRKAKVGKIAAPQPGKNCVLSGHEKVRSVFPDALKEVSDNPAASELLKDFYSAWLAAFDNLERGEREPVPQFEKRKAERQAKYEALWQRFEKEVGEKP